jgi:anthraniloyl-CoA monooxygenase
MSKEEIVETCQQDLRAHLGGHDLMSNANHLRGSAVWMQFPRVICEQLVSRECRADGRCGGDGHFSIGSGSRLAFDSAIALADYLHSEPTMEAAFQRYQDERRVEVLRLQSAARNSLEWFEEVERYLDMPTRAVRLFAADPQPADQPRKPAPARPGLAGRPRTGSSAGRADKPGRAPMFAPVPAARHGAEEPHRRVADGAIQGGGWLPDRLAFRALRRTRQGRRGAGLYRNDLRLAEGRITPGCPGLYAPEHEAAWKRLVDFVHAETDGEDLLSDRPFGAQGSPASAGRTGCSRCLGQLAGDERLGDCRGRRPMQCRRR